MAADGDCCRNIVRKCLINFRGERSVLPCFPETRPHRGVKISGRGSWGNFYGKFHDFMAEGYQQRPNFPHFLLYFPVEVGMDGYSGSYLKFGR